MSCDALPRRLWPVCPRSAPGDHAFTRGPAGGALCPRACAHVRGAGVPAWLPKTSQSRRRVRASRGAGGGHPARVSIRVHLEGTWAATRQRASTPAWANPAATAHSTLPIRRGRVARGASPRQAAATRACSVHPAGRRSTARSRLTELRGGRRVSKRALLGCGARDTAS
jgi:hypothetical protein